MVDFKFSYNLEKVMELAEIYAKQENSSFISTKDFIRAYFQINGKQFKKELKLTNSKIQRVLLKIHAIR